MLVNACTRIHVMITGEPVAGKAGMACRAGDREEGVVKNEPRQWPHRYHVPGVF